MNNYLINLVALIILLSCSVLANEEIDYSKGTLNVTKTMNEISGPVIYYGSDLFLVGMFNGKLSLYENDTFSIIRSSEISNNEITALIKSTYNLFTFIGLSNGSLLIIDLISLKILGEFKIHFLQINKIIEYSKDLLITCSDDNSIALFDLSQSKVIYRLTNVHSEYRITNLFLYDTNRLISLSGNFKVFTIHVSDQIILREEFSSDYIFHSSLLSSANRLKDFFVIGTERDFLYIFDLNFKFLKRITLESGFIQKLTDNTIAVSTSMHDLKSIKIIEISSNSVKILQTKNLINKNREIVSFEMLDKTTFLVAYKYLELDIIKLIQ